MKLREIALSWATEILSRHWPPERFRLEVGRERLRLHRGLDRQIWSIELEVWEHAGVAEVRCGRDGAPDLARFPAEPDESAGPAELPEAVAEAALEAARGDSSGLPLQVRAARRAAGRRGKTLWVSLEHLPHDGRLTLELDPGNGARISFHCLPFQRGSRRSAALGKLSAVERARTQLELPQEARLAYSKLDQRRLGRLWSFRWELREGWIKAAINARSGQLCAWAHVVRPAATIADHPRVERAEAERTLALAVEVRLGPAALLGAPVPGVIQLGGSLHPGWLAIVRTPRGPYRVTLCSGRVSFTKQSPRNRSA